MTALWQELRDRDFVDGYGRVAWWLGRPDDDLTDGQRASLAALPAARPTLAEARTLALEFVRLVRERGGTALAPWLVAAKASTVSALRASHTKHRRKTRVFTRWQPGGAVLPLLECLWFATRCGMGTLPATQSTGEHSSRRSRSAWDGQSSSTVRGGQ